MEFNKKAVLNKLYKVQNIILFTKLNETIQR